MREAGVIALVMICCLLQAALWAAIGVWLILLSTSDCIDRNNQPCEHWNPLYILVTGAIISGLLVAVMAYGVKRINPSAE